jgi:hypothetical protein
LFLNVHKILVFAVSINSTNEEFTQILNLERTEANFIRKIYFGLFQINWHDCQSTIQVSFLVNINAAYIVNLHGRFLREGPLHGFWESLKGSISEASLSGHASHSNQFCLSYSL